MLLTLTVSWWCHVGYNDSSSSRDSSAGISAYRVLVLGAPGVGKSSLVGQFMTSEYLHAYDTSIGKLFYLTKIKLVLIEQKPPEVLVA